MFRIKEKLREEPHCLRVLLFLGPDLMENMNTTEEILDYKELSIDVRLEGITGKVLINLVKILYFRVEVNILQVIV